MFVSLDAEFFDDEDLAGYGKVFDAYGKLNGHLVNEIEESSFSHYIVDLSERPGNWDSRGIEMLSNNQVFAGNHFDGVLNLSGLLAFADIEISNDPNRDDNSGRDDINDRNNRGNDGTREYVLDKFERFFNGDYGTVTREVYEEIVEPAIIELSQAVGNQLTQHEPP